jgi:1-deoxy-D-xylulose-5-phosphate reductoisomerase
MTRIALLGATGSIGASTLAILRAERERFRLHAVAARASGAELGRICREFDVARAALLDPAARADFARSAPPGCRLEVGAEAIAALAADPEVDLIVAAVVGAAGLVATLRAAQAGKRILLANKEALVAGGELVMRAARASGARLLPIDSEHNALFQCLPADRAPAQAGVRRLWLTASGGPFRTWSADAMTRATPEDALKHPNWRMGAKISIDSATMMNKGLEVIEAHHLFDVPPSAIGVVVHPQSTVHALVEYLDGSWLAQLGTPDMRTPIAHALAWPERIAVDVRRLDLIELARLDFEAPDPSRFPCLELAYRALEAGGGAGTILNAANEVAVAAFLERRIGFMDIARVVNACLNHLPLSSPASLEDVLELDRYARARAAEQIAELAHA